MKRILLTQLLAISFVFGAAGQNVLTLTGTIVDLKTQEPLPYVAIVVKNTTIGTIANADGRFVFPIPASLREASLQISILGYESKEIIISTIKKDEVIQLKNVPVLLREVVVRDISPMEIMKRVYRNKAKNYPTQPFQFEGYYREQQRADGKNVSFLEAFASVHDDGYHTNTRQKIFLGQLRLAESYSNPIAPFWDKKNLLVAFLGQNFIKYVRKSKYYKVRRLEDTMIDDVLVYVLEVDMKSSAWPSCIYVRSDNYAVIRTEETFSAERNGVRKWKVEDNPMMQSFPQAKTLQINYKLVNGKYYPESYRMYFKTMYTDVVQKKELLTFEISQHFAVTRLYLDHLQTFNDNNALLENSSLKKINIPIDTSFWKNIPILDSRVDSTLRKDLWH
jgi:hypothetical protein